MAEAMSPTGNATATSSEHGLKVGDKITISGSSPAAYNGNFEVASAKKTTFTFKMDSSPTTASSGTIKITESVKADFTVLISDSVKGASNTSPKSPLEMDGDPLCCRR